MESNKNILYFGDLALEVNKEDIQEFLKDYSESILNIAQDSVHKSIISHKTPPVKVVFKDHESANKCRLEMNLRKLKGHAVRIMWDDRNSNLRHNPALSLFIKNISSSISAREVYEFFAQYGDIYSLKINENQKGNHIGYGYITYYRQEDTEKALKSKEKNAKFDKKMEVERFIGRFFRDNVNNGSKLYVSGFGGKMKLEELENLCKVYGEAEVKKFKDNLNNEFAIVTYNLEHEAKSALEGLSNLEAIKKDKIKIEPYRNLSQRVQFNKINNMNINNTYKNCNLIVKNIPLDCDEDKLKSIFSQYGTITSAKIEKESIEKDGAKHIVSTGFGFICYDNQESAKNALESLNYKYLPGFVTWRKPLLIEYYMSKMDRNKEKNFYESSDPYKIFMDQQQMYMYNMQNSYWPPVYFGQFRGRGRGRGRGNYGNYNRGQGNRSSGYQNNNHPTPPKPTKINMEEYNKLLEEDKKDYLGEKIYKELQDNSIIKDKGLDAEIIAKITGMIIGIPNNEEIINTLEAPQLLEERIKEALALLEIK